MASKPTIWVEFSGDLVSLTPRMVAQIDSPMMMGNTTKSPKKRIASGSNINGLLKVLTFQDDVDTVLMLIMIPR